MITEWDATARLLRRTGFGARGVDVDAAVKAGRSQTIRAMLAADPNADRGAKSTPAPSFDAVAEGDKSGRRDQLQELTAWWLRRMAAVEQPFGEKLTFLWHDHFATSAQKVKSARLMAQQNERLRTTGRGPFRTLAYGMLTDAAMLDWLDGEKNVKGAANENLSREFMELFALGGGYTENDVREGARALTGWRIEADGSTALMPRRHDSGSKTFLGVTGDLDAQGYCDAVLAQPRSGPFVAGRLWGRLVSGTLPAPALSAADIPTALTAMLTDGAFDHARGTSVAMPVEWAIGAVRALDVPLDDAAVKKLAASLKALGQLPFYPPNVSGWPSGQAWLSTASAGIRLQTAQWLARAGRHTARDPESAAHLLGVGTWSNRSLAVLKGAKNQYDLVALALNTPEYLAD